MLLERTLSQLDIGSLPPEQAVALGHMGYVQWLGGLPGAASYVAEARRALDLSAPFAKGSPAVAVFRDLLTASIATPCVPLAIRMPQPQRRGGAQARRILS